MKNIVEVYKEILEKINKIKESTTGEIHIVKKIVEELKTINLPNIKILTDFVHQKPYAYFLIPNQLFRKQRTELGDILFVVKYKEGEKIIDQRALFFQVKYSKDSMKFDFEAHQLWFYLKIHEISFTFGNRVFKNLKTEKIAWSKLSNRENFGDYFLLGSKDVVDISTKTISKHYTHRESGKSKINLEEFCFYKTEFPCYTPPLLDFLSPHGKGEQIEYTYKVFIDLIYKKIGMVPDPPLEHEGFWDGNENDNSGFGIIEITFNDRE